MSCLCAAKYRDKMPRRRRCGFEARPGRYKKDRTVRGASPIGKKPPSFDEKRQTTKRGGGAPTKTPQRRREQTLTNVVTEGAPKKLECANERASRTSSRSNNGGAPSTRRTPREGTKTLTKRRSGPQWSRKNWSRKMKIFMIELLGPFRSNYLIFEKIYIFPAAAVG